jgi:hypothetical protein
LDDSRSEEIDEWGMPKKREEEDFYTLQMFKQKK